MEDLALIASLMVFVPMLIGALAVGFGIYFRVTGKLKLVATTFTALAGGATGFLLFTYAPIAWIPAIPFIAAFLLIYIPKRK
jgi:hypothetical protein